MNRRTLLQTLPLLALPVPALATTQRAAESAPPLQGEVVVGRLLHQEEMCRQFGCVVPRNGWFQGAFWTYLTKDEPSWVEELYRRISQELKEVAVLRQQAFGESSMLRYAVYRSLMASKGKSLPRPSSEAVELLVHNLNAGGQFPYVYSYCYRMDSNGNSVFRGSAAMLAYERQHLRVT